MSALHRKPGSVPSQTDQFAWLQALRPRTRHIEFVFNNADDEAVGATVTHEGLLLGGETR